MAEDPQDLISVYQGANVTEAHLLKDLLLEAEIDACVSEENEPLAGLPICAPDVLVRRADLARAMEIVRQYEEQAIERVERPAWVCPKCGVTVEGDFDECDACGAQPSRYGK